MKAEEAINDILLAQSFEDEVKVLHDYALLQIEKDREQTIKTCLLSQSGEAAKRIRNLPIILD